MVCIHILLLFTTLTHSIYESSNLIPKYRLESISCTYGRKPSITTYALFIAHHIKSRNGMKKIIGHLDDMEKQGFTINHLFADYTFSGDPSSTEMLKEYLESIGKSFDGTNTSSMSDLLQSALEEVQISGDIHHHRDDPNLNNSGTELKGTNTKGVSILRESLKGRKDASKNMDSYSQQLWLESKSLSAAQEQYEEMQKKMPEDIRKMNRLPSDLLDTWRLELRQQIENTINNPDEKESEDIVPFLKLVPTEVISRIVITNIMRLPQHRKRNEDDSSPPLTRFGQFSAIELCQGLGKAIQREHNLIQLNSKKNQKKLNLDKSIHKIHSSGKLFHLAIRQALSRLKKAADEEFDDWKPEWGHQVTISVGSYLLEKATKVFRIPQQVPTDVKGQYR